MLDKALMRQADAVAKMVCKMEEKIAQEWYGCSYDELGYDERGEVTDAAYDRLEGER